MVSLNQQDADPRFREAIEEKLAPGENLLTWCEVFEVEFEAVHGELAQAFDLEVLSMMSWSFLALTNINLRTGTFRNDQITKARLFKAAEYQVVPILSSSNSLGIAQVISSNFLTSQARPQVDKALTAISGWRVGSQIGLLTVTLSNGALLDVASPFEELEEISIQLDLIRSGKLLIDNVQKSTEVVEQLAGLLKGGVISQAEFDAAKAGFIGATYEKRESFSSQLLQLHSLFKSGVLTESEFKQKKWSILSKND
jgi:hypothetical protein